MLRGGGGGGAKRFLGANHKPHHLSWIYKPLVTNKNICLGHLWMAENSTTLVQIRRGAVVKGVEHILTIVLINI